jgi:deoxyribodipyrimidine photo-lyase
MPPARDGRRLIVRHGDPRRRSRALPPNSAPAVYANRDYEPAAIARDAEVNRRLASADSCLLDFKDQVIFERDEVLTQGGTPFLGVHAVQERLAQAPCACRPATPGRSTHMPPIWRRRRRRTPADAGRTRLRADRPGQPAPAHRHERRAGDVPRFRRAHRRLRGHARLSRHIKGCSYLSAHLRFGTISIRQLAAYAHAPGGRGAATWLSELIWRDFYHAILWHHPRVATQCFKPAFDALRWDERARPVRGLVRRAAPVTRWSMPRCASSTRPAGCTTGCAWSRPPS